MHCYPASRILTAVRVGLQLCAADGDMWSSMKIYKYFGLINRITAHNFVLKLVLMCFILKREASVSHPYHFYDSHPF